MWNVFKDRTSMPVVPSARVLGVSLVLMVTACGGGGGGSGGDHQIKTLPVTVGEPYKPDVYPASDTYAAHCASPRKGTDPLTGLPYRDMAGSTTSENQWLRAWTNELYLWYGEVPDLNPGAYATDAYFDLLKTSALTDSGQPKDRFHFSMPTSQWNDLAYASVEYGYGLRYTVTGEAPSRQLLISFVEPEPAQSVTSSRLQRGTRILAVDGVSIATANDQASFDVLNAGLAPSRAGLQHRFRVQGISDVSPRDVTLTSIRVTSNPVPQVATLDVSGDKVGYLLFNDHLAQSEQKLVTAINTLKSANVTDLVLDLRYNGGGLLAIASELAYMIAGPDATAGKVFESTIFNDKIHDNDPVTGEPLVPVEFFSTALGFSQTSGTPLPTLNLSRVYVLASEDTCSASESLINGLRGINVEVVLVGGTTCGKPYGFYPTDNCGTTYFSIQMKGENAAGFGDYADGFSPSNTVGGAGVRVTGCAVSDDLHHALGDTQEAMLAAALQYRANSTCPPDVQAHARSSRSPAVGPELGAPSLLRTNKFLRLTPPN